MGIQLGVKGAGSWKLEAESRKLEAQSRKFKLFLYMNSSMPAI